MNHLLLNSSIKGIPGSGEEEESHFINGLGHREEGRYRITTRNGFWDLCDLTGQEGVDGNSFLPVLHIEIDILSFFNESLLFQSTV